MCAAGERFLGSLARDGVARKVGEALAEIDRGTFVLLVVAIYSTPQTFLCSV